MKLVLLMFIGVLSFFLLAPREVCQAADDSDSIFKAKVGEFEVYTLSERQSDGALSILIGASSEDIKKYIPTGNYPTAVNAFAVRTPGGVILIDTGLGQKLPDNLKKIGLSAEDIDVILITHSHGDHIGGLVKNASPAFPNAKVYIAEAEYDWSAQVRQSLSGYSGRVNFFTPGSLETSGDELLSGVRTIAAYGHTPGHTLFLIESSGERLLVWGDLTHAMAIQMPRPGVSVTYDSDPIQAAEVRKAVLKYALDQKIPIAGMHIAYPGIGMIERDPEVAGSYKFVPFSK